MSKPKNAGSVASNATPAAKSKSPKSASSTQAAKMTSPSPGATEPGEDVELVEREQMIRQAAYHRYLQRNGAPGNPEDDWRAAEAEIDRPGPQTNGKRERP